jgi:hypothetical protein
MQVTIQEPKNCSCCCCCCCCSRQTQQASPSDSAHHLHASTHTLPLPAAATHRARAAAAASFWHSRHAPRRSDPERSRDQCRNGRQRLPVNVTKKKQPRMEGCKNVSRSVQMLARCAGTAAVASPSTSTLWITSAAVCEQRCSCCSAELSLFLLPPLTLPPDHLNKTSAAARRRSEWISARPAPSCMCRVCAAVTRGNIRKTRTCATRCIDAVTRAVTIHAKCQSAPPPHFSSSS